MADASHQKKKCKSSPIIIMLKSLDMLRLKFVILSVKKESGEILAFQKDSFQ
jgi:hypothetical protein